MIFGQFSEWEFAERQKIELITVSQARHVMPREKSCRAIIELVKDFSPHFPFDEFSLVDDGGGGGGNGVKSENEMQQ